jgi:tetratricopeptide (TPR) repeat protein
MNNRSSFGFFLLLPLLAALRPAPACCPYFPISYTAPSVVAGTFDDGDRDVGYRVRLNVRHELALLGRHWFPEWAGRELSHVPLSAAAAHRADFLEAASAAGLAPDAAQKRLDALFAFADSAETALKSGRTAALPPRLAPFEREFFLYALGRAQRLADDSLSIPPAWLELLVLPPADRPYRTVWARHGLVLAAPDFPSADIRLRSLRADLDAGFRDTCGLEEAVVHQLLRRGLSLADRLHWLPLAAAVSPSPRIEGALVADADWLGSVHPLADRWTRRVPPETVRAIAAADPLATEVLVTLHGEKILPEDLSSAAPLLCASRRAWAAFEDGDFERGRRLLALAPSNSLVRLFWEARLARIDGDYPRSAALLREWLAEVAARGGVPENVFEIHSDWGLWLEDSLREESVRTRSMPRVVQGELGGVLLTQGDFEEALLAFLRARSWIDAAFVAERCMTADALAAFIRQLPPELLDWDTAKWGSCTRADALLPWLLARRLMREGRPAEAGPFFPEAHRREWELWTSLSAAARPSPDASPDARDDTRALAALNLACLIFTRGMELFGTELEPDVRNEGGAFSWSGIGPHRTPESFPGAPPLPEPLPPLPDTRFHYRGLALDAARLAASLADDPDIIAAACLLDGHINALSSYLRNATPDDADPAYKRLCAIPSHPLAQAARDARWFPWPQAKPFLDALDDVRHTSTAFFTPFTLPSLRPLLRPSS